MDKLKGVDRARAEVLFEAAEQAGWVAHLALVTLWQSGSAEGEDYEYSRYRSGRHRWYDEDEEDDEYEDQRQQAGKCITLPLRRSGHCIGYKETHCIFTSLLRHTRE